ARARPRRGLPARQLGLPRADRPAAMRPIAFFLALAIEPAVSRMAALGMRRGFATFLVFLALMVAAGGFVTMLGSMLAGQIITMIEGFPEYLDSVINWVNATFHTELRRVDVQEELLHSE